MSNKPQIAVIYEDEHILAIDKPAGLTVHKTHPADPHETLADILVRERPYLASVGDLPAGSQGTNLRPGIVHRLDKETSGVMLIAKDPPTFEYLKGQFRNRLVKKEYLALVNDSPREPLGTITLPLGKVGTRQTTQLKGRRELVEREAITDYKTLKRYRDYTLVEVSPRTGRTHQIRVHMKAIGCPLVGDKLYGPKTTNDKRKMSELGLDRLFLHAEKLQFTTHDGKALALEAGLPSELQRVLDSLTQM